MVIYIKCQRYYIILNSLQVCCYKNDTDFFEQNELFTIKQEGDSLIQIKLETERREI
jgi:hypothetical protein